jgi:hypothetical protein
MQDVHDKCAAACTVFSSIVADIDRLRSQQASNAAQHVDFANEVAGKVVVCTISPRLLVGMILHAAPRYPD